MSAGTSSTPSPSDCARHTSGRRTESIASWLRIIGLVSRAKGCSCNSSNALAIYKPSQRAIVTTRHRPFGAVAERVTFPADIWRLAEPRWQNLGYPPLSAYITG